jgi:carboxypeptidase family protein
VRHRVVGAISACAVLTMFAACTTSEPVATLQPTGRSLLPPTSVPGSPSPSASGEIGRDASGQAGAADTDTAARPATSTAPSATASPHATKKPREPAISGQVLAGGSPVTGAQVTITGDGYHHNTTTSSEGRFQSAALPGTYTIAVAASGMSCPTRTVTVQPNQVSRVTITCSA